MRTAGCGCDRAWEWIVPELRSESRAVEQLFVGGVRVEDQRGVDGEVGDVGGDPAGHRQGEVGGGHDCVGAADHPMEQETHLPGRDECRLAQHRLAGERHGKIGVSLIVVDDSHGLRIGALVGRGQTATTTAVTAAAAIDLDGPIAVDNGHRIVAVGVGGGRGEVSQPAQRGVGEELHARQWIAVGVMHPAVKVNVAASTSWMRYLISEKSAGGSLPSFTPEDAV